MNLPTKITCARIFLIPIFVILFFVVFPYNRVAATAVFMIASFTDFLDGYLARKNNQVTVLGKFLDPIADKLLVACALIAICVDKSDFQTLIVIFTMIIISREFIISAFRTIASTKNVILAADKLGKIKTVLQMIALILLLPSMDFYSINKLFADIIFYSGLAFLGLATIITLVSALNYIIKNRQVLKD